MKKIKTEIPKEIKLTVEEIQHPNQTPEFWLKWRRKLWKKNAFRRTMKQIMEKAMASHNVKGVKVAMSGRLDGSKWEEKNG